MTENLVITLLHKQLTEQLEHADRQLLLDWLASSTSNQKVRDDVSQVWDLSANYTPAFTPNVEKSFEKFSQRINAEKELSSPKTESKVLKLNPIRSWMKYAAAAIIVLGSVMVWQFTKTITVEQLMASTIENEIKDIDLADGTRVWLNEKSSFNYPDKFSGENRTVHLEGQAFFDVREDNKPFIIKGGSADVRVLGTSFSFNTANPMGLVEVEVKDGTVELSQEGSDKKLVLTKNERGYFDPINKKFLEKELLSVSNADYFVTNSYKFVNSKYTFVFGILSNVYDVEFEFGNEGLENCLLTSPIEFDRNNIESMIKTLEEVYTHRNLKFTKVNDDKFLINAIPCVN